MSSVPARYVLVACSECDKYGTWIADRAKTQTHCRYCGVRYDVEERHFFATATSAKDLPALRDTRGQINAERSGELSSWRRERKGTPFGEQVSLLTDWQCESSEEVPSYARLYRDRADEYLDQRMGPASEDSPPPLFRDAFKEEAEAYLARRMGPATRESERTNATAFLDDGSNAFPWADDPTGLDKTRLVLAAASLGDFPTDPVLWGDVFDAEFDDGEKKLRSRSNWLAEHYPNLWEKGKTENGFVTVNPTAEAVYLIRAYVHAIGRNGCRGWSMTGPSMRMETRFQPCGFARLSEGIEGLGMG